MDNSSDQGARPTSAEQGAATRSAILQAAAALIAELGWGRVTTRAIAVRAGVPHGAVSYHFQGKDDLLRQAAVAATLQVLAEPLEVAGRAGGVREVLQGTLAWYASGGIDDPSVALLLETVRQAARDPALREPIAAELRAYREALGGLVETDREHGRVAPGASAAGVATIVAALMDGLLLHLILDPELDVQEAANTALNLLKGQS